jgi:uncharacterized protein
MSRLLFWIAIIILIVMAVRSKLRGILNDGQPASPQPQPQPQARVADESERMACCAQCGLHFPASEAVRVDGREYCSVAHAPGR